MTKRQYVPLDSKDKLKTGTRSLVLTTGILAGLVAVGGATQAVDAEELDLDQEELKELYDHYQDIDRSESEEEDALKQRSDLTEEQKEELAFIKIQLIKMIELAGGQDILDQLHNHSLSYDQLDTIFNALLEQKLNLEPKKPVEAIEDTNEEAMKELTEESEIEEELSSEKLETDVSDEETVKDEQTEKNKETDQLAQSADADAASERTEKVAKTESEMKEKEEIAEVKAEAKVDAAARTIKTAGLEEPLVYVVKPGDTLGKIAQRYGTTVNTLASLNHLTNVNRLSIGQVLAVNEAGQKEAKGTQPTQPKNLNQVSSSSEFIENISAYAQKVASENNLYASVMIAQASLESGYGKSSLSAPPNHNLFGIKGSYNGQSVAKRTQEYYASTGWITITDNFKKYPSYEESLKDNANLLRRGLRSNAAFYSGTWAENAASFRDATSWLQGRYATDPTYASKLNRIIDQFDLTRYDIVETKKDAEETVRPVVPETPESIAQNPYDKVTSYKIVSGDTLGKIARAFKTTVNDLKAANDLNGDLIFVNQEILVPVIETNLEPEKTPDRSDSSEQADGAEEKEDKQENVSDTPDKEESEKENGPGIKDEKTDNRYTVVRGDSLSKIARRYSTTVAQLKDMNRLLGDTIYVGQKLKVSNPSTDSTEANKEKEKEKPQEIVDRNDAAEHSDSVIVFRGDSLSRLAVRFDTTVTALKAANKLASDTIYVGQRLVLPKAVSKPEEKPAPSPEKEAATPSGKEDQTRYTVKSGDTLSQIARRFETTVSKIKTANKLSGDVIYVGQKLTVRKTDQSGEATSGPEQVTVKPNKPKPETKPQTTRTITVKPGDSLSQIARSQKVTLAELLEWNNIKDANRIYVGQKLTVAQAAVSDKPEKTDRPVETPVSVPVAEKIKSYKVKAGDNLSRIAKTYDVTVSQLKNWNKLTSDIIFVNQTLTVGETETKQTTQNKSTVAYTVRPGDSLYKIAREQDTTVRRLKELNSLKSDLIFVDQLLTV